MQLSTLSLSSLRRWIHALIIVSILLNIFPLPSFVTLANVTLSESLAAQVIQSTASLLPAAASAKAAAPASSFAPLLNRNRDAVGKRTLARPVEKSVEKPVEKPAESVDASALAAPLAQPTLAIGNRVWKDTNGNGVQDSGEPGIAGMTVELMDGSGNPVMCMDAGVTGYYLDGFETFPNGSAGSLLWDWRTAWVGSFQTAAGWGNPGYGVFIGTSATPTIGVSTTRSIDLSVFGSNPVLNYDVASYLISSGTVRADYSVDGGAHYTVLGSGTGFPTASTFTFTLPITATVATAKLRFVLQSNTAVTILDNVKVSGQTLQPQTAVTDASGVYTFTDSDCVTAGGNYSLRIAQNQSMLTGYALSPQDAGGVTSNDATLDNADSDAASSTISGTQYAVISNITAPASGSNNSFDVGFAPILPTLVVSKGLVGGSSSAAFGVTVSGPSGVVSQTTITAGSVLTFAALSEGTYTVTESSLPTAPSGYYWLPATYSPPSGVTQLVYGDVKTISINNALAPAGQANSMILTKTVQSSTNSGPYNVAISGANSYVTNTTIISGVNTISRLPAGVLTVTETSPGAGWVTTYTVGSISNSSSAVVTSGSQITVTAVTPGVITGTVYSDYNENGTKGTYDMGVPYITVTAYDRNGNAVGNTNTSASGTYTLTPSAAGPWRLEFTNLPAGYAPSRVSTGTQNGTSTQFITSTTSGSNNFAINRPCDYCQPTPPILQAMKMLDGYGTLASIQKEAFLFVGQYNTGTTLATGNQTGSLWGLAWSPTNQTIYAGATIQVDQQMGLGGAGAIYAVSPTGSPAPTLFTTIPNVGNTTLISSPGTTGLGDIDINADGSMLYTVNLYDKQLYAIPVTNPSAMQAYPIPNDCEGGTPRPWATEVYNGKVYVGVSCDAALSQLDEYLHEYVYEFNPTTTTWATVVDRMPSATWSPWTDIYTYGNLLIADIEFDESGRIILNEMNRGNLMTSNGGASGQGDFVRLCPSGAGTWVNCAGTISNQVSLDAIGGMAFVNSLGQFVIGTSDPIPGGQTGIDGATLYDAYTAANLGSYYSYSSGGQTGRYGKGTGVGDLELLCDPAPIEIGNRVWYDVNNNGVQDPGEQSLSGVVVSLTTISGTITTTTNLNGNYYFTREATTGAYATTLRPNTAYTISINPVQAALSGYSLTVANAQGINNSDPASNDAILDTRDSDGILIGGLATIYYTTGSIGENNHSLDFGFTKPASSQVSILNSAPLLGALQIVKQVTGGTSSDPFTLTVSGPSGYNVITTVTTSSARVITGLTAGTYTVTESSLPDAPLGFAWGTASYSQTNGAITLSGGTTGIVTITNPLTPTVQRFGDRLWLEGDSDGIASTNFVGPVANQVLTATNASGTVYTTTTDSNGIYTFTVPAGTYTVTYGLPPTGYQASSTPGGGVVNAASGGNDTSHSNNTVVTLNPNDTITTVDFAFSLVSTPTLRINKVATPTTVSAGDLVTYTITLTNDGPGVGSNITVRDLLPAEVTYINSTATSGAYSMSTQEWLIPTLPIGSQTLTIVARVK